MPVYEKGGKRSNIYIYIYRTKGTNFIYTGTKKLNIDKKVFCTFIIRSVI